MKIVGGSETTYSGRELGDRRSSSPNRTLAKLAKSAEGAPVAATQQSQKDL